MVKKYTRRRHRHNRSTLRARKHRQKSADIFAFLKHRGGYKHTKTPGEQLISSPRKTKTKTKTKTNTRRSKSRRGFKFF